MLSVQVQLNTEYCYFLCTNFIKFLHWFIIKHDR